MEVTIVYYKAARYLYILNMLTFAFEVRADKHTVKSIPCTFACDFEKEKEKRRNLSYDWTVAK